MIGSRSNARAGLGLRAGVRASHSYPHICLAFIHVAQASAVCSSLLDTCDMTVSFVPDSHQSNPIQGWARTAYFTVPNVLPVYRSLPSITNDACY